MSEAPLHPYLRLMRFDKPTGLWLLMWPCWWSVVLAWRGGDHPGLPYATLALFLLGAAFMRAAGCIINDIVDRDIDRKVERTRNRPLASGEVTLQEAVLLVVCLLWLSLIIAWLLGPAVVVLSGVWLIPIVMYPWMKRITWWPQAFLGLTFNAGALFGWAAVKGTLGWTAILLHAGAIGWTLGYDTIYAHQDKIDDAKVGVKSSALRLGERSKPWLFVFYGVFVACLAGCGALTQARPLYYLLLCPVAAHLAWQVIGVDLSSRESCWRVFRSNVVTGGLVFAAILAA